MAFTEISTTAPHQPDPWAYARKTLLWLLLVGATAMILIGYTDYKKGLATPLDIYMLPVVAAVTLMSAAVVALSERYTKPALGINGIVLVSYYEALIFQAVVSTDPVSTYSLASITQYLPGLYIALFVLLSRHAAQVSWVIYGSMAAQCLYGLFWATGSAEAPLKEQLYWSILASHPCCILVLTFMNHLRTMVEDTRQESLAAKERFLALVSHEVRTPLQTIVSSLEVVETAPPGGPLLARATRRIKGAAGVLEAQIRDLTAFTRLELSPDLHLAPVELTGLMASIAQVHQEQAQSKGLHVSLHVPPAAFTVKADAARLRQILDNLVGNAIKYTTQGTIKIELVREADGMSLWRVSDTGRGIPADRLARVFEPFVRLQPTQQDRVEGSGLGLTVVRQLVGSMQGRIRIQSDEGRGTVVEVRLPLDTVADADQAVETRPMPRAVLIVDDDIDILHALSDLLRQGGVDDIVAVGDGEAALQALAQRTVAVALIDLQLPGISGYELAQAIRDDQANAGTTLIAMSAQPLDRRKAGARAFHHYVAKPVEGATLIEVLRQAGRA